LADWNLAGLHVHDHRATVAVALQPVYPSAQHDRRAVSRIVWVPLGWRKLHVNVLLATDLGELPAAVTPPPAEVLHHLANPLLLSTRIPRSARVDTCPRVRQGAFELLVGGSGRHRLN